MRDLDYFRTLGGHMVSPEGGGFSRVTGTEFANTGNPTQVSEPTDQIPGNSSTPFTLTLGQTETGVVNTAGDDDWFRVTLTAGQSYVFTLNGDPGASGLQDAFLELHDSNGALISIDDDGGATGFNSLLRYTATQSGTYYINARAWEPDAPAAPTLTGSYSITFNTGPAQNPIDTILWGVQLPSTTIDVYFATTGESFGGQTAIQSWTPSEITAAMAALATWSAVIPVTFQQTLNSAAAEFHLVLADLGPGLLGQMSPTTGNGAFNPNGSGWTAAGLMPGGDGFVTLVHEFGHGVGLAHPHDNGGNSEIMQGVLSEFGSYGTFLLNQGVFTTMSYNDGWPLGQLGSNPSPSTTGGQGGPMALDIAAVQQIYGVNPNTGAGSTTYTLTTSQSAFIAIWDVSGTDTISFAAGSVDATIDLRPASLLNEIGGGGWVSHVAGAFGGFTIAHGVVIENATGGNGNDTITGNSANNVLIGNQGQDTISAGDGNDTITGGVANDVINGGSGFDVSNYSAASSAVTWTRATNGSWTIATTGTFEGNDTVTSVELLHFANRDVHLDRAFQTFSGDGTSDILFERNDGLLATWSVQGTSLTSSALLTVVGPEWTALGTADFNGDDRDDILWQRSDGTVFTWQMNSASAIGSAGAITALGAEWSYLATGDFNGDARDDIAWQRNDGLVVVWQMDGRTISTSGAVAALGPEWHLQGVGDFNSDGHDDFLWRNTAGQTYIWDMNGTTIAHVGGTSAQAGVEWSVAGVGDFNGDGFDDILWRRNDGVIVGWQMNGDTVASSGILASVGPEWHIMQIGDYNGDGKDDILWQNDSGTVYTWILNGNSITQAGAIATVGGEWGII